MNLGFFVNDTKAQNPSQENQLGQISYENNKNAQKIEKQIVNKAKKAVKKHVKCLGSGERF